MRWAAQRTVAPVAEPLDLPSAKQHLRLDIPDDDLLVTDLISVARDYCERVTGLALMPQTWQLLLDRWPRTDRVEMWPAPGRPPGAILLPLWPVTAVSSITWIDSTGTPQTLAASSYSVDTVSRPARIVPASLNMSWPTQPTPSTLNTIAVTFTAGYASAAAIPPSMRQAMRLLIGHWYEHRESVLADARAAAIALPQAVDTLLGFNAPYLVG